MEDVLRFIALAPVVIAVGLGIVLICTTDTHDLNFDEEEKD